ncbi:hypothetical protein AV530_014588 [Patagioenas fasciata monilis]|uniref:Uncharacterized protein n=1 Tax=Patagioenas fasciata monilis TaxID=372326 RepID=A0A1V4KCH9_PATFA|nr:hypothetical protein AV530_014588 [Patagioenas fasciata monilis]
MCSEMQRAAYKVKRSSCSSPDTRGRDERQASSNTSQQDENTVPAKETLQSKISERQVRKRTKFSATKRGNMFSEFLPHADTLERSNSQPGQENVSGLPRTEEKGRLLKFQGEDSAPEDLSSELEEVRAVLDGKTSLIMLLLRSRGKMDLFLVHVKMQRLLQPSGLWHAKVMLPKCILQLGQENSAAAAEAFSKGTETDA